MNTIPQHAHQATSMLGDQDFVTRATQTTSRIMRWLALGAVAGPVLFTLAWIILGEISPGYTAWGVHIAPYSPISQPISGLGLGVTAPFMNAAFAICGILLLIGVIGTFHSIREIGSGARWLCIVLLGPAAIGMAMDGIFTLESGFLHFAGFGLGIVLAMLGFVVGGLILRRVPSFRRFGTWLMLGCPLTLALTILYFLTFTPTAAGVESGVAGLTERILVCEVLAWYAIMGWLAFRRS